MKKENFGGFKLIGFNKRQGAGYTGLKVLNNGIYISCGAYEKMDFPESVMVLMDNKTKEVMLIPAERGTKGSYAITAKDFPSGRKSGTLGIMNIGTMISRNRYYFDRLTKEGGFIFK